MYILSLLLSLLYLTSAGIVSAESCIAKNFSIKKDQTPACKIKNLNFHNSVYYASISSELFKERIFCGDYVVAALVDDNIKSHFKIVKAIIRDKCTDCSSTQIKLSKKAFNDLQDDDETEQTEINIMWAILSSNGEILHGPFSPENMGEFVEKEYIGIALKRFVEKAKKLVFKDKVHDVALPWHHKAKENHSSSKKEDEEITSIIINNEVEDAEETEINSDVEDEEEMITTEEIDNVENDDDNDDEYEYVTSYLVETSTKTILDIETEYVDSIDDSDDIITDYIDDAETEIENDDENEDEDEEQSDDDSVFGEVERIHNYKMSKIIENINLNNDIDTEKEKSKKVKILHKSVIINAPKEVKNSKAIEKNIKEEVEVEDDTPFEEVAKKLPKIDMNATVVVEEDDIEETEEEKGNSTSTVITGTVLVSIAAGATLLFIHNRPKKYSDEQNSRYLTSISTDVYESINTKSMKRRSMNMNMNNYDTFDEIAHIQIFSPKMKRMSLGGPSYVTSSSLPSVNNKQNDESFEVYNIHNELEYARKQQAQKIQDELMMENVVDETVVEVPCQLMSQKENINGTDCYCNTSRLADVPSLITFEEDPNQKIYNSVPTARLSLLDMDNSMIKTEGFDHEGEEMAITHDDNVPTDVLVDLQDDSEYTDSEYSSCSEDEE